MIVVTRMANGPIRAVLEMEEARLNLFRPRERNALLARSLERAVRDWRGRYMRVWFSREVLGPPYSYNGDHNTPLVDKGDMARLVYTGQIVARSPGGNVKCTVTMPRGHPVHEEIARVMKVVPKGQISFIAQKFAGYVAGAIDSSDVEPTRKPGVVPRRSLTTRQRHRFGVTARKSRK